MIISKDVIQSWKWRVAKAGKTLDDLATASGITPASISNAINGKRDPQFNTVCAVEKVLTQWGFEYEPEKTA